jgi:ABC-type multidrug transport system ATPase subunit
MGVHRPTVCRLPASHHRFDIVEQLCSRVLILSGGHIVAEHAMASLGDARSPSLEDVFVRATGQDDFTPVANKILDIVQIV